MIQVNTKKAIGLFKANNGILTTHEALKLGINSKTLYRMRDSGCIEAISRGLYYLDSSNVAIDNIDLITVVKRIPKEVICLISALSFHGLTTQIPHFVYAAYQQNWRQPKLNYPPLKIFRYSTASFEAGIEHHVINGVSIPIYSAAKTVIDCFKFRHKIGLDIAIEALKEYWKQNNNAVIADLLEYARICRVKNIIYPYLGTIIHE